MFQLLNKLIIVGFALLFSVYFSAIHAQLTVEKIWKDFEFRSSYFEGFNGMNDGQHFTKINKSATSISITQHSYTNYKGEGKVLVGPKELTYQGQLLDIDNYEFNKDETKLLLRTNEKPIYRRSFTADYYIYNFKTKQLESLDETKKGATLAEFSPDGTKIAFVYQNNIYIKDLTSNIVTAVTTDGKINQIINGTTDWVYEEEFSITKGFEWSYDGKKIAFLRFDESAVKEFNLEYHTKNAYPLIYKYKYPKAGEDNSKVTVAIYDLNTQKNQFVALTNYEYIPRLKWSSTANVLILQTLNRHQNELNFYKINATQTQLEPQLFFKETSTTYIEIDDNLLLLSNGKELIRTSEISGYKHLYRLDFNGNQTAITTGNWEVIEILGMNEEKKMVYYSAAEKGPIHKGIYQISFEGKNKRALSNETGQNDAEFANGMNYFVLTSSTAATPPVTTLHEVSGKHIADLEKNETLKSTLSKYPLSSKEFINFTGNGGSLYGWMIKPQGFDATKKYPVYINIYGGPGHNMVEDGWGGNDFMYHQLLAQSGYIVISVDPRGTLYRGVEHKKATYLQMGKYELDDFISTVQELKKLPYVDGARIGIQGWSYGGFMTSLAMTKGAEHFKMGIAVAPVTNWKYYDNIYTERFMRTPQENKEGYENNSPINHAKNLKGKYLLIHGSTDDNVHYQNALELINALVQSNVQFDQFCYPNRNHSIYGGNTRNHLFQMMYQYTLKNL